MVIIYIFPQPFQLEPFLLPPPRAFVGWRFLTNVLRMLPSSGCIPARPFSPPPFSNLSSQPNLRPLGASALGLAPRRFGVGLCVRGSVRVCGTVAASGGLCLPLCLGKGTNHKVFSKIPALGGSFACEKGMNY